MIALLDAAAFLLLAVSVLVHTAVLRRMLREWSDLEQLCVAAIASSAKARWSK